MVAAPHYRVLRWAAPQGFRETIEEAIDVADGARVGKPLPVLLGCGRTVCAIHPKRFHMCIFLFGSFSVVFTFEHFVTKTRAVAGRRITRQSVAPPDKTEPTSETVSNDWQPGPSFYPFIRGTLKKLTRG